MGMTMWKTIALVFCLCTLATAQQLNLCFDVEEVSAESFCTYDGYKFGFSIPQKVGNLVRRAALRDRRPDDESAFVQFAEVDPILPNEINFRSGLILNVNNQVSLMIGEDDFLIGIPATWVGRRRKNRRNRVDDTAIVSYEDFENDDEQCRLVWKDCQEFRQFTINLAAAA